MCKQFFLRDIICPLHPNLQHRRFWSVDRYLLCPQTPSTKNRRELKVSFRFRYEIWLHNCESTNMLLAFLKWRASFCVALHQGPYQCKSAMCHLPSMHPERFFRFSSWAWKILKLSRQYRWVEPYSPLSFAWREMGIKGLSGKAGNWRAEGSILSGVGWWVRRGSGFFPWGTVRIWL